MQFAAIKKLGQLRRRNERWAQMRTRTITPMAPGTLLKFIPRLSPELHEPKHLDPFAEALERSLTRTVEACVSLPPRHGKTVCVLHAIVWILLNDPTATILYASYAHGFAAKQVRKAMRLAVKAGIALGDTRRRDEWTTAAGGSVKAVGVGGQITGEGFRWIFVDDPHKNRAEAESRTIREGVIDGFLSDIYTRQDPQGTSIFVVHTRWHEADLIGTLTAATAANEDSDAPIAKPFEYINLTAIRAEAANDGSYRKVALAPQLFTVERLLTIRARIGEYAWASLYDGSPRPKSGVLFGDVTLIDALEEAGSYRYAIGVDFNRSARSRSDWCVAVVMRINVATKQIDVCEVKRMQGTLSDRVEGRGSEAERIDDGFLKALHGIAARYPAAPVVMNCAKDETLLISLAGRHDKYPVRIRAKIADSSKYKRAHPYAGAWNSQDGRLRVLRNAHWTNIFVAEHVGFTGDDGDKDDQVDAAGAAYDFLVAGSGVVPMKPRGSGAGSEAARIGRNVAC